VNVAPTVRLAFMLTVQIGPFAVSQPVQALKAEPASAVAVSVTTVPAANPLPQPLPQLMPGGLLITLPLPFLSSVSRGLQDPDVQPLAHDWTAFQAQPPGAHFSTVLPLQWTESGVHRAAVHAPLLQHPWQAPQSPGHVQDVSPASHVPLPQPVQVPPLHVPPQLAAHVPLHPSETVAVRQAGQAGVHSGSHVLPLHVPAQLAAQVP